MFAGLVNEQKAGYNVRTPLSRLRRVFLRVEDQNQKLIDEDTRLKGCITELE